MPPRRTLTGKAAMASRHAEFLAAHDRTQNGREAMASCRAEFIAARDLTTMWEEFEDAKAKWAVEQEAAKATQRERKSQKALKKREARHRKKKGRTRCCGEVGGDPSTVGCRRQSREGERRRLASM